MEKWVAWFKDLGAKGHLKNPGHPLDGTGKVVSGKQKTIKDGPSPSQGCGGRLYHRRAKDLVHATELSKGCPILEVGGSVEVRPVQILTCKWSLATSLSARVGPNGFRADADFGFTISPWPKTCAGGLLPRD